MQIPSGLAERGNDSCRLALARHIAFRLSAMDETDIDELFDGASVWSVGPWLKLRGDSSVKALLTHSETGGMITHIDYEVHLEAPRRLTIPRRNVLKVNAMIGSSSAPCTNIGAITCSDFDWKCRKTRKTRL